MAPLPVVNKPPPIYNAIPGRRAREPQRIHSPTITNRVVESYLLCQRKAHLVANDQSGTLHEYEILMDELRDEQRPLAEAALLRRFGVDTSPRLTSEWS